MQTPIEETEKSITVEYHGIEYSVSYVERWIETSPERRFSPAEWEREIEVLYIINEDEPNANLAPLNLKDSFDKALYDRIMEEI